MTERTEIPLHADSPPGMAQVIGWVIGANVFVLVTVSLIFVVLPWLAGHQPQLNASTVMIAGATGIALMVGFLFVSFRRHQKKHVGTPSAKLVLDDDNARLVFGTETRSCPREDFVARPVHAHEVLKGVDYYMGPAVELRFGEETWVVATIDGRRRWGHDPPAVQRIDWLCNTDAWKQLLVAEELDDGLVAYDGT